MIFDSRYWVCIVSTASLNDCLEGKGAYLGSNRFNDEKMDYVLKLYNMLISELLLDAVGCIDADV